MNRRTMLYLFHSARRAAYPLLLVCATLLTLAALGSPKAHAAYLDVHDFIGSPSEPSSPVCAFVQDANGNYYGTSEIGGKSNHGTVFKMDPNFGITILHSFTGGADGDFPTCTLIIANNPTGGFPTLFGTTLKGGKANLGVAFKIATDGSGFTVLHDFLGAPNDGANPWAGVILGSDNKLYGTTVNGGMFKLGTTYSMTRTGAAYVVTHNFSGMTAGVAIDGAHPYARLFEYQKGLLTGTTAEGGDGGNGILYGEKFTGAAYGSWHTFNGGGGARPTAEVIQLMSPTGAPELYGTTFSGGATGNGIIYRVNPGGGGFDVAYSFMGPDGANPFAALVFDPATGFIYGTTLNGGGMSLGTAYMANPASASPIPEAPIHVFGVGPDGQNPQAALIVSIIGGDLYGTTRAGGAAFDGTAFKQSP